MVCNTVNTELPASGAVDVVKAELLLWDISAQVINTVNCGDPIAAYRICLNGRLSDVEPSTPLNITSTDTSESIEFGSVIDIHRNHDCFSIACIPTSSFTCNPAGKCPKQPLLIAVSNDNILTAADIVLHPHFPGVEGNTREDTMLDRNTFLLPFQSNIKDHVSIRPASLLEVLSLYLSGASLPSCLKFKLAREPPDLTTMIYGTCP